MILEMRSYVSIFSRLEIIWRGMIHVHDVIFL